MFNGSGKPIDRGPSVLAEDYLDIMGMTLFLLFYSTKQTKFVSVAFRNGVQTHKNKAGYLGGDAS